MERIQVMHDLKQLYEAIIESQDVKSYLYRQTDIEKLYDTLYALQDEPYEGIEKKLLQQLVQLNATVQSLMDAALNRMQKNRELSPIVAKHYEQQAYNEAYFFDKKH